MPGKVVRVAKIPAKELSPLDADKLVAEVCYYYQQYTFAQARRLSYKRVVMLLKTARRLRATHYFELAQIAAAPHTERGKGFTELINRYRDEARDGE